nr:hypothetical protein 1634Bnrm2_p128 [Cryptomonas sp.]
MFYENLAGVITKKNKNKIPINFTNENFKHYYYCEKYRFRASSFLNNSTLNPYFVSIINFNKSNPFLHYIKKEKLYKKILSSFLLLFKYNSLSKYYLHIEKQSKLEKYIYLIKPIYTEDQVFLWMKIALNIYLEAKTKCKTTYKFSKKFLMNINSNLFSEIKRNFIRRIFTTILKIVIYKIEKKKKIFSVLKDFLIILINFQIKKKSGFKCSIFTQSIIYKDICFNLVK